MLPLLHTLDLKTLKELLCGSLMLQMAQTTFVKEVYRKSLTGWKIDTNHQVTAYVCSLKAIF